MFDVTSPYDPKPVAAGRMQRARGRVSLGVSRRADGKSGLDVLFQSGAAKARLPAVYDHAGMDAVLINTAGGLTGGDEFQVDCAVGAGAFLRVTTQASEKIYRAVPGSSPARVENRMQVAAGAHLEWLPQDMILFDGASLSRVLELRLAASSRFLGLEMVVFGRSAMGETLRHGFLADRWRVWRDEALVYAEDTRLEGDIAAHLARPAVAGGALAALTGIYQGPALEDVRETIRSVPRPDGVEANASLMRGLVAFRALGASSDALRRWVAEIYVALAGLSLPRAWSI